MNTQQLFENIKKKGSFLCVGLDTDIEKIPSFLLDESTDPVFEFNKAIIDATAQYAVAYKPNLAFYESNGVKGWESLEKTVKYLRQNFPDILLLPMQNAATLGTLLRCMPGHFSVRWILML